MASQTGKVGCIQIFSDDVAWTQIIDSAGVGEVFVLWSDITNPNPPIHDRVTRSNWVSLLRQALADDLDVTVVGDNATSALTTSVQLGTFTL
ncbi:hypothetical protein J2S43_002945 [Catenuloplanes nepalensis]|uniref:Uncharacterized protein n=1 Tax=Catenuloplanes nepalensis TaxID=587533 RepID=A0ABT9MT44_9ACTN|nr:hypothetical protein [Catenuloplanes nepalensis]MDP9794433.1 hypothetical protein [Catenuloplanes nepalensis]